MAFSTKQLQALRRNVDSRYVRTREANGRELSYIEGWYAISEANRIFGFEGWNRETIESRCVLARETRGNFIAVYIARVRITVRAHGASVVREGHGTGEGRGTSPGEVHDIALKAAETDATKRALATFGKPFGLELYRTHKPTTAQDPLAFDGPSPSIRMRGWASTPMIQRQYLGPQNTMADVSLSFRLTDRTRQTAKAPTTRAKVFRCPKKPRICRLSRIDKSVLTIGEPKRLRDKAHLRFVASQPCIVCGRQPSDPHHLEVRAASSHRPQGQR